MPLGRHHADSAALRKAVCEETGGTCLLSFSAGKDAVCSWLALREAGFTKIVPFYLWTIPDLAFVEDGLCYYEDFFKTPIIRTPHANFPRFMTNLIFQSPEQAHIIEKMRWPTNSYDIIERTIRITHKMPDAYVAIGIRSADSPDRMTTIKKHGSLNPARRSFFPIFDWRIEDIRRAIAKANIKLVVDYDLFGRTFDGIDHRFTEPIKRVFPEDYARILKWFPLAHLDIDRRELAKNRGKYKK